MATVNKLVQALTEIGTDIKAARLSRGDMNNLPTADKTSIVNALIEIKSQMVAGGAVIDDNAPGTEEDTTYSAAKITMLLAAAIAMAKDELRGGASTAMDTFKELEDELATGSSAAQAMASALNNRLRFDEPQLLDAAQKLQACQNIGFGDPETDFLAAYNAAKA